MNVTVSHIRSALQECYPPQEHPIFPVLSAVKC